MIQQREIKLVPAELPHGVIEYHPIIVISTQDIMNCEDGMFYGVMCSSVIEPREFSLELTSEMVTTIEGDGLAKQTYVKTHLIYPYFPHDIQRHIGSVKKGAFDQIKEKIYKTIFEGID